jgi:two-component system OmpR family sensor kinase
LVPALAGWIGWTTARGFETSRNLHYAVMLSTEKDKFLASVSHELRTPLAAVSGFIKELRQGWRWLGEEERDEYLQIVDEQTEEITSIVRDLLVATRLDSDEIALQPEAVPAPRLVGQALESMPLPPDRRIVVEVAEVEVWADALRTRQIVRNLVANAVRHGGPNIRVTAEASDSEVCLQVADDGEGIPHHIEAAVFDAYVEGAGRPLPSMGLGLFVSRRLAECMGGRLEYERNDGTTVFKLELPRPAPLPSTISA